MNKKTIQSSLLNDGDEGEVLKRASSSFGGVAVSINPSSFIRIQNSRGTTVVTNSTLLATRPGLLVLNAILLISGNKKLNCTHAAVGLMDYHHRQLFNEKYRPKGFCHAIRRPQHYPEGTLSLESRNEKGDYRPVPCLVHF